MKIRMNSLVLSTALASALIALFVVGCGKTSDGMASAAPGTTLGTKIDDSIITTSVKSALLADPDIKSFDFKVETRKGEVLLSGFVDSQTQIDRAISVARTVQGVASVKNDMSIKK